MRIENLLEKFKKENWFWLAKRLSGNDTGITGGHQVGLYVPRWFCEEVFPEVVTCDEMNPDTCMPKAVFYGKVSHIAENVRVIYYNNKYFPEKAPKGTRDEFRMTKWGGKACPLQNHENTGSIWIAGFKIDPEYGGAVSSLNWVTTSQDEENAIERWIGDAVEPGLFYSKDRVQGKSINQSVMKLIDSKIPEQWYEQFPSGKEIVNLVISCIRQKKNQTVDSLLMARRKVEFEVFSKIEKQHLAPVLKDGIDDSDSLIQIANKILNRRKSRSGRSLELHLSSIFRGANLKFTEQAKIEKNKRPDFLFPGEKEYKIWKSDFKIDLHMLAAKTCCKDRWRQILNEVSPEKIPIKHLFTLQNGVSLNQVSEMMDSNVQLVVPKMNIESFHKDCRKNLWSLEEFVRFIAESQGFEFNGQMEPGY